jgi:hypothetical protein
VPAFRYNLNALKAMLMLTVHSRLISRPGPYMLAPSLLVSTFGAEAR